MAFEKHNSERFIYLADDDSDDRDFFAVALLEINPKVILRQIQDGIYLMDAILALCNTLLQISVMVLYGRDIK